MTEAARLLRNRTRLMECHPVVRTQLAQVLTAMLALGYRCRIQCAWRSPEDEETAYREGHSAVAWGFHNASTPDGKPDALAADVLDDDAPLAPSRAYLLALTRVAHAHGLNTGILWGLPDNTRVAINAALATGGDWTGPLGWDPTHLECVGISIAAARSGRRPLEMVGKASLGDVE